MTAAGSTRQRTVEVAQVDSGLTADDGAEGAGKGVREEGAVLSIIDVGLRGLVGIGGSEHQHIGNTGDGLAPQAAVAGLDGQEHAAELHLLDDAADAACAESLA